MEIDSLKTQLGNLLALHRDEDANEDDIVFATVDYMKKAHDVAQMLLLEGRFQELQRCLHLCQAAFCDTTNVRASVAGRSGSYDPLLFSAWPSSEAPADAADQRTSKPSSASAAGERNADRAQIKASSPPPVQQQQQQQRYPFFVLSSDEDRRVFAALQSRTAQLQKQLEAAMRVRRGRDTEYYMQRLGLSGKSAAPVEEKDERVKPDVQPLPALPSCHTSSGVAPPAPPERGVSFGNQVHFSRGKGRIELPPLVTSGRLFGVSHDNPMSMQHTVFGSSAAATVAPRGTPQQSGCHAASRKATLAHDNDDDDDGDFGIRAVEAVFGVQRATDEVPLYMQPVPEDARLWSSSSLSSSSSSPKDSSATSRAFSGTMASLRVKAPSPPPLSPEPTVIDDVPLVSVVTQTTAADDDDDDVGEDADGVFASRSGRRASSTLFSTLKSSVLPSVAQSAGSTGRREKSIGGSGNHSASEGGAAASSSSVTRLISPSWLHLTNKRKWSADPQGIGETSNFAFNASNSPTLVSAAESSGTTTTSIATTTPTSTSNATCTTASDQQEVALSQQHASPAALEAARTVETARQTTQYVLSSIKALHSRSDQALQRCDALAISRLPYSTRLAVMSARDGNAAATASAGGSTPTSSAAASLLETPSLAPHAHDDEEWTPVSQPLTVSLSSYALSSMPTSPGTYATLASPSQLAVSAAGSAGWSVVADAQVGQPPTLLGPAAEQLLREVRANYERQLACAARNVQVLEARWASQHSRLRTRASLPPLENIAEWRKRRRRQQQQPSMSHPRQRHGQPRYRSRRLPPLSRSGGGGGRDSDASLFVPSPPPSQEQPSHSPTSRSPLLTSATPTRARRLSSYNAEEGSGPLSCRSSSDETPRPSLEALRLEWRDDGAPPPLLVTPVDHQLLPLVGGPKGNAQTSLVQPSRYSRRNSPQTLSNSLTTASPPRVMPAIGSFHELPSPLMRSTATAVAVASDSSSGGGKGADAVRGAMGAQATSTTDTAAAWPRPLPSNANDESGAEDGREAAISAGRGANGSPQHVSASSFSSDLEGGALAETGVYARRDEVSLRSSGHDNSLDGVPGVAPQPYTYHPAVVAILRARQRRREAQSPLRTGNGSESGGGADLPSQPFAVPDETASTTSTATEDILATWRRTLHALAGEAKSDKAARDDASADASDARSPALRSWGPQLTWRASTAVHSSSFPLVNTAPSPPLRQCDAAPVHHHGIRCGGAAIRARHAEAVLRAAIRDASAHVREDDLVRPAWRPQQQQHESEAGAASREMAEATITTAPPSAVTRQQEQPPLLFDLADIFAACGGSRSSSSLAVAATRTQLATTAGTSKAIDGSGGDLTTTLTTRGGQRARRSVTAAHRTSEMSLVSVPSTATMTSTPVALSLTAQALTPRSSGRIMTTTVTDSDAGTPQKATAAGNLASNARETTGSISSVNNANCNSRSLHEGRSVLSSPPDSAPLPSLSGSSGHSAASAAAAHDAYQRLHAAYRVSAMLHRAADWTTIPPALLGRCLPLCIASVRLQRWWRQRRAARELRRRQHRVSVAVSLQHRRDAAALRIQRQLRVHWARCIMARHQAAAALATEQRVASENPAAAAASGLARANTSNCSGYGAPVELQLGISGALTASTMPSQQSHRAMKRFVGSETSSISTDEDNDTQHHAFAAKDPWAAAAAAARRSASHSDYEAFDPRHSAFSSKVSSNAVTCAPARQRGAVTAVAVLRTTSGAEVVPLQPFSSSTSAGDGAVSGGAATSPLGNATDKKKQIITRARPSMEKTQRTLPQDPVSAARRIQRWYRRHSVEEAAQLQREVEVLAAVVTRRAPLTSVRDALRSSAIAHSGGAASGTGSTDKTSSGGVTDDHSNLGSASSRGLADAGDCDVMTDPAAMRALLAMCTGDVYQAYLRRGAAARQHGDYKTPLEHVSLRSLQHSRQERADEAKQQRLLLERQQRLCAEQQRRRDRQVTSAAKLLQRVGRGLRWRRWLRERQCRDLRYSATHTLDLLSQPGLLSVHGVDHRRGTAARSQVGQSTTAEEAQCVFLSGGRKVTAHVMARLRTAHPEWFRLHEDRASAAWITVNATPTQRAAVVTVQSFVRVFASRAAAYRQYLHACARSIQLVWRLHQQRKQRRLRRTKLKCMS